MNNAKECRSDKFMKTVYHTVSSMENTSIRENGSCIENVSMYLAIYRNWVLGSYGKLYLHVHSMSH